MWDVKFHHSVFGHHVLNLFPCPLIRIKLLWRSRQDLVLLAEELGHKVSGKMTIIDLKNIVIGSKDYEEEFVRAQLSVISEERVERETEEKITRQHAIQQMRWESELN
ncbi:hypothetical protein TNCV_3637121 [Trichonephila clavipes]|nr:hypothetical protein TNCV_3637121 [Trichonephila clavipes]